jgi:hypothetical protein
MKRYLLAPALAGLLLVSCGGDDDGGTSDTTPAAASAGTTATTAAPAATTAAPATTAASSVPASTTANEGRAATLTLAAADLAGWTMAPSDDEDGSDGPDYSVPECAKLQALGESPQLQDDAEVALLAPDGKTEVDENVTVGDPAAIQAAFDTFAAPETATCLTAMFTKELSQPGAMPEGVTFGGIQFAQQPLTGGEQAVGYVATITATGTQTGITAPIGVRFDAVRAGDAIAVLTTLTTPGAAPVDPAAVATAAGQKLMAGG